MKTHHIVLALMVGSLCSCELTGDPTQGGIFWSASKAKQRQADLWQTYQTKAQEAQAVAAETSSLKNTKAAIRKKIAAKQAELQQASTPTEVAELQREINSLESQLAGMSM